MGFQEIGWSAHCRASVLPCQRVWQAVEGPWLPLEKVLYDYTPGIFKHYPAKFASSFFPFLNCKMALNSSLSKGAELLINLQFLTGFISCQKYLRSHRFWSGVLWSCPLRAQGWNAFLCYQLYRPRNSYEISKTELKAFVWQLLKTKVPLLMTSTSRHPSGKRNCSWNSIFWCKSIKLNVFS